MSQQSLTSGTILVTGGSVLFLGSGYLVNVWLGRSLGPADYGVFSTAIAVVTVLTVMQTATIPAAVARFVAQDERQSEATLFRGTALQLFIAACLAASFVVGAPALAAAFGDPALIAPLRMGAAVFVPYGLYSLFSAYHSGLRNYRVQALMLAIYSAAKVVGALTLAHLFSVVGAVAGYTSAPLAGLLVGWRRSRRRGAVVGYRPLVTYAAPLAILALATIGQLSVDLFLVKAVSADRASAGYYAAAQQIARIPYYLIGGGLGLIALPVVARAAADPERDVAATVRNLLRAAAFAGLPLTAFIAGTAGQLIEVMYTARYSPAAFPTVLLSIGMGMLSMFTILAAVLNGLGKSVTTAWIATVGLTLTFVTGALTVPSFGLEGAATSAVAGAGCVASLAARQVYRALPRAIPARSILSVVAVSILVGVLLAIGEPSAYMLPIAYLGAAAGCIAALALVGELRQGDISALRGTLRVRR